MYRHLKRSNQRLAHLVFGYQNCEALVNELVAQDKVSEALLLWRRFRYISVRMRFVDATPVLAKRLRVDTPRVFVLQHASTSSCWLIPTAPTRSR
jgi:hypothetical protein